MRIIQTVLLISALSATAMSSGEFKWGNVMMGGGGFVSAIITSKTEPNLIYARTDVGGAYRWNEAAQSWIPITDWVNHRRMGLLGIDALAIDPSNPSRVYMLAGTEYWNQGLTMILRSDNYGETFDTINVTHLFKTHGNGYGRQNGERLAVDPNNPNVLLVGTRDDGLWRSADRGTTWSNVQNAPTLRNKLGICFVLFDPTKTANGLTSRIYIGLSRDRDNLYVSDDAGETWEPIAFPSLSRTLMPQRAVLTPGGRFLYVAAANGAGPGFGTGTTINRGAVLKYDTEAKAWSNISPENFLDNPPHPQWPNQTDHDAHFGGFGGISMCAADSNRIIVSSINTWRPQIWDGTGVAGWGDRIYETTDGGTTWRGIFGNLTDEDINNITGSEQIAVLYKNGFNWIEGESIHWAGSIEIDPFNPKRVFVTSGNGIYMADNFSAGERFRFNFTVRGIEETVPIDVASIPGGPLITVIKDYDGFVHNDITKPVLGSRHNPRMGCTYGLDFAKLRPNIVVRAGGDDRPESHNDYRFPLYYSLDTARTWTKFVTNPGPGGQNFKGKIAISSDGRVVIWAPENRNVIFRTDNWGATWTTSTGISSNTPLPKADPIDPAVFYAFNSGRVHISNDTGKTFTPGGQCGNISWTRDMQVTPGIKGHVWVAGIGWDIETADNPIHGGLARSVDGGLTFHDIDPQSGGLWGYTQRVQHAEAIGFGKAAPGAVYPAIYISGTIDNIRGIWQSIDEAKTWTRIDEPKYAFGALANGNFVRGDMNTFGVVYRSTAGRGIAARMPAEWMDNPVVGVRRPQTNRPHFSPHVRLHGQTLTLTPPNGAPLTVSVYDLRGRTVFRKTYNSAVTLRSRDMVKARGSYVITVRDAAKTTVFRGKMTVSGL